jgi:tetratricopeptide (TPR) repeat protein
VSADRAHLLAALGRARAATGAYQPAHEALQEALNIAFQLSDRKLEARLLSGRSLVNVYFFRLREAAADGFLSKQLGGSEAPPWHRALQLQILQGALLHLGRLEEAVKIAAELEPLARKIGQSDSVALCRYARTWAEFGRAPDLAKLETDLRQVSEYGQRAPFAFSEVLSEAQLSLLDFLRGDWSRALLHAQASPRPHEGGSIAEGFGVGMAFRQMAYAGDRDGALATLDQQRTSLPLSGQPNTIGSWIMLALVIEGLFVLDEQSQAARLYPLAGELVDTGAVALFSILRLTQTIAGVSAAAARQWEAAEDHFQVAMQQAESLPHRLEQAEIRRFHAMMLINRAAPGDRPSAKRLLREALESYASVGMPRHIEMTQTLLKQAA